MTMVDVDDGLYKNASKFVEKNKVDFPTIQFFVNQSIKEKLEKKSR
jgi:hypothetical protein